MTEFDAVVEWITEDPAERAQLCTVETVNAVLAYPRLRELLEEAGRIRTAEPRDTYGPTWVFVAGEGTTE